TECRPRAVHHSTRTARHITTGQTLPEAALVIDLTGITFCDSSGMTVLIAARNHALAAQADIALAAVPDRVSRMLHIVGLDQVFPTHATAQAAAAAWTPPTPTPE
ncbi:STAS domain-containing protein, partial [Streptomyces mirabilis]